MIIASLTILEYWKSQKKKRDLSIKKHKNIIYFFYKFNGVNKECLYIGETSLTLYDRCYIHSPKEKDQLWFQQANCIYIIELANFIDDLTRRAMEALLIGIIRPMYNKK